MELISPCCSAHKRPGGSFTQPRARPPMTPRRFLGAISSPRGDAAVPPLTWWGERRGQAVASPGWGREGEGKGQSPPLRLRPSEVPPAIGRGKRCSGEGGGHKGF